MVPTNVKPSWWRRMSIRWKGKNGSWIASFDGHYNHNSSGTDWVLRGSHFRWFASLPVSLGSSVLGTEDDLAVSLRFMNFGTSRPSSDEDSGLSSFVENPQYFCGIIKEKDMCKWCWACFHLFLLWWCAKVHFLNPPTCLNPQICLIAGYFPQAIEHMVVRGLIALTLFFSHFSFHTFQKHLSIFYHKVSSISNARTSCWSGSWVKEPSAKSTSQNVPTSALTVTRCWSPSKWVNLHRCYVVSFPVNICSSSETNSVVAAHFCRSAGKRKTEKDRNKMRKRYI